jgi:alpha-1,6-mannosyltransferase
MTSITVLSRGRDQLVRYAAALTGSLRRLAWLGFVGSALMAISSYWVGAIPLYFRTGHTPVVSLITISSLGPRIAFYVGLAAMLFAWLRIGRLTLAGRPGTGWKPLRRIALCWLVPLAVAMPIGSRDLWAYAAQSQLVLHHLNPYSLGPSALPGAFSVEVSHRWIDTPAPYGPLWLLMGHIIAAVVGNHVGITVAVLRLLAIIGLLILAATVPALASRIGTRPNVAVWLVVLNPLTLVLGVGGGHNDLLMVALMVAGLAVLTGRGSARRSLGLGIVLLTAATAIKSPAVVAVAFAVPLWLRYAPAAASWKGRKAVIRSVAVAVLGSAMTFAAITAVSGLGLGWVKQINSAAPVVSWMSLPSLGAIVWDLLQGHFHRAIRLDIPMEHFRTVGTVISVVSLVALWWLATRTRLCAAASLVARWPRRGFDIWALLAASLFVVVVLGPSVQPWYFCWALAIVCFVPIDVKRLALIAGSCVGLVAMIRPNGTGLQMNPVGIVILGCAIVLAWRILVSHGIEQVADQPVSGEPTDGQILRAATVSGTTARVVTNPSSTLNDVVTI